MIRLNDLSGENVWMGACSLMAWLIDSRFAAVNISGACRLVMRSVLLGGVGWLSGGRSDRSRERLGECERLRFEARDGEEVLDCGGVETSIAVAAMVY